MNETQHDKLADARDVVITTMNCLNLLETVRYAHHRDMPEGRTDAEKLERARQIKTIHDQLLHNLTVATRAMTWAIKPELFSEYYISKTVTTIDVGQQRLEFIAYQVNT